MIPIEIKHRIADKIKSVPVFSRHLLRRGCRMGTNDVYIAPISIWSNHIEVMVDTRRNVFDKAIKKFMDENKDVSAVRFIRGGIFTPYIVFKIAEV